MKSYTKKRFPTDYIDYIDDYEESYDESYDDLPEEYVGLVYNEETGEYEYPEPEEECVDDDYVDDDY